MIGKDITKLQSLIDELDKQNEEIYKQQEEIINEDITQATVENVIE